MPNVVQGGRNCQTGGASEANAQCGEYKMVFRG